MFSFLRNFKTMPRSQPIARMSMICRGLPIDREELFLYTNGHFLVDEHRQLNRRYLKFDIDALCDVGATAGGDSSGVVTIEKFEGGFSKALLIKTHNGKEVIAKMPCRIAGPPSLTTAAEVGALKYLREYTSIPVPRVLSWSADSANPVGAEYVIMEKAEGVPLYQQWGKMAEIEKLELIRNLTKLEAQLSAISFPAYGGLYYRTNTTQFNSEVLDETIDSSGLFAVGPSCERSFNTDPAADVPLPAGDIDQGPWRTISSFGVSIVKRELSRMNNKHLRGELMFYEGSDEEKVHLLEATERLMPEFDSHPLLHHSSQPTLWHTDLHMGNIFVAPDENSRIVSLIDFQSVSVLPLFLQAQWPVFLKPPQNYTKGLVQPKLPDDFDQLDDEYQAIARQEWTQAKLAKAYEVATFLENRAAHNAMNIPRVFREFFYALRACLIEIYQNWSSLAFTGECPYSFSEEEIARHELQFSEYEAWHEVQKLAQECLDTDAEGWISPLLDIEEKRRQNKELLAMYTQRVGGEKTPEEAKAMWPFPEIGC